MLPPWIRWPEHELWATPPDDPRKCTKCKSRKPLSEFTRSRYGVQGYASWCRECLSSARPATPERPPRPPKPPTAQPGHKRCAGCEEEKPFAAFRKKGDSLRSRCRDCESRSRPRSRRNREEAAAAAILTGKKVCIGPCGAERPLAVFPARKASLDGRGNVCTACLAARQAARRGFVAPEDAPLVERWEERKARFEERVAAAKRK